LTEKAAKVNPKVAITARVGKGKVGVSVPVLVEDIAFSGNIRIKLKLFNEMPHVKSVDVSFLQKPHYDFVLKPLGGDAFGSDVNNVKKTHLFFLCVLLTHN
jgi:Ca2+-dependent lipid-binding protein